MPYACTNRQDTRNGLIWKGRFGLLQDEFDRIVASQAATNKGFLEPQITNLNGGEDGHVSGGRPAGFHDCTIGLVRREFPGPKENRKGHISLRCSADKANLWNEYRSGFD